MARPGDQAQPWGLGLSRGDLLLPISLAFFTIKQNGNKSKTPLCPASLPLVKQCCECFLAPKSAPVIDERATTWTQHQPPAVTVQLCKGVNSGLKPAAPAQGDGEAQGGAWAVSVGVFLKSVSFHSICLMFMLHISVFLNFMNQCLHIYMG